MKKKKRFLTLGFLFVFIAFTVALWSGCAQKAADKSNIALPENYFDPMELLLETSEFLANASKGADNPMASIGGFMEELEQIKALSIPIIEKIDNISFMSKTSDCEIVIDEQKEAIIFHHDVLSKKLSDIRLSKQEKNISDLKNHLSDMLDLIYNYEIFIDTLESEMPND